MSIDIVLVQPEIPPNTGNVARSCAVAGSRLHLVGPLGFSIDDRSLKRAGLDYWPYVNVTVYDDLEEFMIRHSGRRMHLATTKGSKLYTEAEYRESDMILFGRETAGLPKDFIYRNIEKTIRIPMSAETRLRSLNLANSVNIILFEAMRQMGFPGLK